MTNKYFLVILLGLLLSYRPMIILVRNSRIPWCSFAQVLFIILIPLPHFFGYEVNDYVFVAWLVLMCSGVAISSIILYWAKDERIEVLSFSGAGEYFVLVLWFIFVSAAFCATFCWSLF